VLDVCLLNKKMAGREVWAKGHLLAYFLTLTLLHIRQVISLLYSKAVPKTNTTSARKIYKLADSSRAADGMRGGGGELLWSLLFCSLQVYFPFSKALERNIS
jgi:hypothetical protein